MNVFIISPDNKMSRLIEIEIMFKYKDINIIKLSNIKDIPTNIQDNNSLVIADFDYLKLKQSTEFSEKCKIIGFGQNNISQLPKTSAFLKRPFLMSEICDKVALFLNNENNLVSNISPKISDVSLLHEKQIAIIGGKSIYFSETEFKILQTLSENCNKIVSRSELSKLIKGNKANSVDVYICMLRKKIDVPLDSRYIRTVRGKGYMFYNE